MLTTKATKEHKGKPQTLTTEATEAHRGRHTSSLGCLEKDGHGFLENIMSNSRASGLAAGTFHLWSAQARAMISLMTAVLASA